MYFSNIWVQANDYPSVSKNEKKKMERAIISLTEGGQEVKNKIRNVNGQ